MSQLEQALFKTYTDPMYRENVQNGIEKLEGLTEEERAAVKALSSESMNYDGGSGPYQWCERRR